MTITGYSRALFGEKLNTVVSPAQPIHSIEHLVGRTSELERIEKALYAPGRHIFIYGDRGVGKSSLAATAASQYQSSDAGYIDIGCAPDSTLQDLVANIAQQAANLSRIHAITKTERHSVDLKYFRIEGSTSHVTKNIRAEIHSLVDAVEVLREVSIIHSERPVIVLDEFDRIKSQEERNRFADLLKNLGDKRIPIKFVITGVSKTLEALLGAHQSAIRQLETIELSKLSWEARWEIILNAARVFDVEVPRDIYLRIAAVSDGYPFYVHLITEKLLWRIFEDPSQTRIVNKHHFYDALQDAIQSISAELKRPYEIAVNQRTGDYEEILWLTADSEYLHRYLKDMYGSYGHIIQQMPNKQGLDYEKFCSRIRSLKSPLNGEILVSEGRKGLYTYKEKMLRGYVCMQAAANRIELLGERSDKEDKQYMHVPARVNTGYRQSSIPKGVHMGRKNEKD